jgi:plastocyanin
MTHHGGFRAPGNRRGIAGVAMGYVTHTVTADDGSFDSGNLSPDKTFSHTFDQAGTFKYHCSLHASMIVTVVVS